MGQAQNLRSCKEAQGSQWSTGGPGGRDAEQNLRNPHLCTRVYSQGDCCKVGGGAGAGADAGAIRVEVVATGGRGRTTTKETEQRNGRSRSREILEGARS